MTPANYLVVDETAICQGHQSPSFARLTSLLVEDAQNEDLAVAHEHLRVFFGGFDEAAAPDWVHFQLFFDKLEFALACSINRLFNTKSLGRNKSAGNAPACLLTTENINSGGRLIHKAVQQEHAVTALAAQPRLIEMMLRLEVEPMRFSLHLNEPLMVAVDEQDLANRFEALL